MLIGIELERYFDKKRASPDCPHWIYPRGKDWAFYHEDIGIRLDEEGIRCEGQRSQGGNLNPRCEDCPIRGKKFTDINYRNYLEKGY